MVHVVAVVVVVVVLVMSSQEKSESDLVAVIHFNINVLRWHYMVAFYLSQRGGQIKESRTSVTTIGLWGICSLVSFGFNVRCDSQSLHFWQKRLPGYFKGNSLVLAARQVGVPSLVSQTGSRCEGGVSARSGKLVWQLFGFLHGLRVLVCSLYLLLITLPLRPNSPPFHFFDIFTTLVLTIVASFTLVWPGRWDVMDLFCFLELRRCTYNCYQRRGARERRRGVEPR
jgi:hypothetical protein